MKIGVFGLGYVGATTMACLAEIGHDIVGVDVNPDKVKLIQSGNCPVVEPGLAGLLAKHVQNRKISATIFIRVCRSPILFSPTL